MRRGLAVALGLAGCQPAADAPVVYPLSLDTAFERLRHADLDGFRDARQCGILIHFHATETGSAGVIFDAESSGVRVLQFTVLLAPAGNGTQATIVVPPGHDGKGEAYDGNQAYQQPAVMQPLRPAVRELIDAAMAQRPYDWHRLPAPLNTGPAGDNTAGVCASERQNLEAGGATYDVRDPQGMTHDQASAWQDAEQDRVNAPPEDATKPTLDPHPDPAAGRPDADPAPGGQ